MGSAVMQVQKHKREIAGRTHASKTLPATNPLVKLFSGQISVRAGSRSEPGAWVLYVSQES
jgi:hypothetical protein